MIRTASLLEVQSLRHLSADGRLLFATRVARMFAYGLISVVLVFYLAARGLDTNTTGLLLTAALLGDVLISLAITLVADRVGRRRMLMLGAGLMIAAGASMALTDSPLLLILALVIGTISPSGNEVGAFLSIEQAALPQTTQDRYRTSVFAWYNLIGAFATAFGALAAGSLTGALQHQGITPLDTYRAILLVYTLLGVALLIMFARLSSGAEPAAQTGQASAKPRFGVHQSRGIVYRLAALFMVDAFAGGLVLQSFVAFWFNQRFGVSAEVLGGIFFGANILSGLSALAAGRIAARIGLINTMVWTHIPSNILLMLVPLMPSLPLAILVLLARFSISQMDVPTRQSYIMAVVAPDERSAAAGITTLARTGASALSPTLTGAFFSAALFNLPFFLAGALKIAYDLMLYRNFRALKPPEEQ